jgi:uncharacterized membrane protein
MRPWTTLDLLTLCGALGSGLIAGVFFIFSVCVMKALAELPPAHGIAAMQSINRVILNPWFLGVFLGTLVPSLWLAIAALQRWSAPQAGYWLAGGLLYAAGTFAVTMVFNVPRNNALDQLAPDAAEAALAWASYLRTWTAWNHVRASAALAACAAFALALRLRE